MAKLVLKRFVKIVVASRPLLLRAFTYGLLSLERLIARSTFTLGMLNGKTVTI